MAMDIFPSRRYVFPHIFYHRQDFHQTWLKTTWWVSFNKYELLSLRGYLGLPLLSWWRPWCSSFKFFVMSFCLRSLSCVRFFPCLFSYFIFLSINIILPQTVTCRYYKIRNKTCIMLSLASSWGKYILVQQQFEDTYQVISRTPLNDRQSNG